MPKLKSKLPNNFFPFYEIRRREIGDKIPIGWESKIKNSLYSSLVPGNSWDPLDHQITSGKAGYHPKFVSHGGVYNLEFSPDGTQLVAACEEKAILVFDSLQQKQIHHIPKAHGNCVNGIKFLDSRVFASCSDDQTVALWDIRSLKKRIRLLRGHSNWVKNIEYCSSNGMLVTSGFDGKILGWDINGYTEEGPAFSNLFNMQGLMRMRLTPDESKLVICTTGGYIVLIHNLSLPHLAQDLQDFKPNMYRFMQLSRVPIPKPASFTHLFSAKRNRVEFITDFPPFNNAEVIHSLQVHPQGWCILSRNTSNEDLTEWSCVHDIQDLPPVEPSRPEESGNISSGNLLSSFGGHCVAEGSEASEDNGQGSQEEESESTGMMVSVRRVPRAEIPLRQRRMQVDDDNDSDLDDEDTNRERGRRNDDDTDQQDNDDDDELEGADFNFQFRFTSVDVTEAFQHITRARAEENRRERRRRYARQNQVDGAGSAAGAGEESGTNRAREPRRIWSRARVRADDYFMRRGQRQAIFIIPQQPCRLRAYENDQNLTIAKNVPRLTHYIDEPNVGRGFIKELCFSSDGRLICSPHGNGVRLMMFDEHCSELSHCVKKTPEKLYDVSTNTCHSNCVVSTKFSPTHCLLVSGCLSGKIVWHQPIL